jgi:hypothetical protein
MAFTGSILARIAASLSGAPDIGAAAFALGSGFSHTFPFADGAGLNMANMVVIDHATATTSYDLDGTTLPHPSGNGNYAAGFARIKAIAVKAAAANSANITVGGDFILSKYLTAWVDDALTIPVHVGGLFLFVAPAAAGVVVTATTGDVVTVTVAGSDAFDIVILGSST